MSVSAAASQRSVWADVLVIVAVILGMIGGFNVATAPPASADAECSTVDSHPTFDFERLWLELDGGALTIDTTDPNVTCTGDQSLGVFLDGVKVEVIELDPDHQTSGGTEPSDGTDFHLSCSDDYTNATVRIGDVTYTVTDYILASRHTKQNTYLNSCEAFPEPDPDISLVKDAVVGDGSELVAGDTNPALVFSPDDEGPKTALYSYTITNEGDEALVNLSLSDDRLGALDLSDPDVSDCPTVLAVNTSCTVTASEDFDIDDAPGTITNTGTVNADGQESGDPVSDTDPATIDLVVVFDPDISLVKDAVVGDGSDLVAGDTNPALVFSPEDDEGPKTALYSYTITNDGDEALVNLSLSDDRLGALDLSDPDVSDCPTVLAVNTSCTVTASEDFDIDDAPGTITNTGTVNADGQESGDPVSDTDPATIDLVLTFDPDISLVKDPVLTSADSDSDLIAGDTNPFLVFSPVDDEGPKTALYSYTITNTGDEPLVNLDLSDDRIGAGDLDVSDCPEVLGVGDSCTATGSEDFGIDDAEDTITNLGTVTADGQESGDPVSDNDPATIDLALTFGPDISLAKDPVLASADSDSDLLAGDTNPFLTFSPEDDEAPKTALYSYTITNTGNEALVNLDLSDDRIGAGDLDLSDCPDVLAIGSSCTATGSEVFSIDDAETDIDGAVTNLGTVTADGEESGDDVSDEDPATIDLVVTYDPLISLDKVAVVGDGSDLVAGDTNPFLTFSPEDDEASKTALYSYTITNTGDEPLVNLSLSDDRLGALDLSDPDVSDCPTVLAVDDSCTVTGSEVFTLADAEADADGTVTNLGTVTADGQESGDDVSDEDPATIDLVVTYDPLISLDKVAVVGDGSDLVGGDTNPFLTFSPEDDEGPKTALYSYTITNDGDEPLVNLSLSDDRLGELDLSDADFSDCPTVLAVDASCTVTASEDFDLEDAADTITNLGTVTADGQESGDPVSDEDPATIDLVVAFDAAISLVKDAVVGDGSDLVAGDPNPELGFSSSDEGPKTALYSYTITNIGDEALVNLSLSDDRLGDLDLSDCPTVLAVGDSCTATGSEDFTLADAEADADGAVTNLGTVTADGDESGTPVTDDDPATIVFSVVFDEPPLERPDPIEIDLVKEVVAGEGDVRDADGLAVVGWSQQEFEDGVAKTVRYRFTITNIGESTIVDVALIDPMISDDPIISKADGVTLEPGESTVVEVDHLLTTDEAFPNGPIATKVDNVAAVSGANVAGDQFSEDTDNASVVTEIVFAEVLEQDEPLPATGFGAGGLLPVSALLMAVGAAILWLDRRRATIR